MAKKRSYSIIDFLIDISNMVTNPNGKEASPYDVNFTNHYNSLYNLEENYRDTGINVETIDKIVQDNRKKTITIDFKNNSITSNTTKEIQDYCNENNIDCDVKRGQVKAITINKKTKGVFEERSWKNT